MKDKTKEKRILLVDDEAEILEIVETVLENQGYKYVVSARSGEEAMRLCREYQPDIIVLDIMLPDMDGYDVCREIRKESTVPIIFLSAMSDEVDRLLSFAIGGDDYLSKPFSPKEVVYRIKAILSRMVEKAPEKTIVVAKDLEIYRNEAIVRKNGVELQLTAMEFKLLLYLVENQNMVLSKTQLLEAVWGMDFEGFDQTVAVHIRHLREKLEDNVSKPKYIQTIKHLGYKFIGS